MTDIITALEKCLGEQQVIHGTDLTNRATSYWRPEPTQTLALLRPRNTNEVSQILKLCHAHNQPVVVQGGLTGCVDGAISTDKELIISLERMNKIESIDPVGGTATVEAGVILEVLHSTLADEGLMFPLDLGARGSCTIGGNISTNAGGINVLRYGMMRDLVLGLEAVLADGTVISSMNQMIKNNAGYDIKQLTHFNIPFKSCINVYGRIFGYETTCYRRNIAYKSISFQIFILVLKTKQHCCLLIVAKVKISSKKVILMTTNFCSK